MGLECRTVCLGKRIFSILCVVLMIVTTQGITSFISTIEVSAAESEYENDPDNIDLNGSGIETDPYLITTPDDLWKVTNAAKTRELKGHYILTDDIDLIGEWMPISNFKGIFNGNGHIISGISINDKEAEKIGLFKSTSHAIIKNLTVSGSVLGQGSVGLLIGTDFGSKITGCAAVGDVSGTSAIGGLIGGNGRHNGEYSTISKCSAQCNVYGESYAIGGLIGNNVGAVTDCYSASNVISDKSSYNDVGGLIGANTGAITNCYATGNVSGGRLYTGGLIGSNRNNNVIITNCYAMGGVSGIEYVGGLIGSVGSNNDSSIITNCYATGNVSGNECIGGLIGSNNDNSEITNCYATGSATGNVYIGGLIGKNLRAINNCYATGDVSGNRYIGGLIGSSSERITNCYAWGDVSGESYTGGLVGCNENSGVITSCYATGDVLGKTATGGLVGRVYNSKIVNSCASGSVSGDKDTGGLIGIYSIAKNADYEVIDCYATGDVSGDEYIGGLIGSCPSGLFDSNTVTSCITNCYAVGNVSGNKEVGGLIGSKRNGIDIINCYFNIGILNNGSSYGSAKTLEELRTQETYENWDFGEIWAINERINAGFPYLKMIGDVAPVFVFTLENAGSGVEGTTIALSGTLTLDDSVEATEKNLSKAADAIYLKSSDESKVKVLTCETFQNDDKKSAILKVWLTLYNEGTATITAKSAYSPTVNCEIAISADTSGKNSRYECDYTEEMQDFFVDKGVTNAIKYFCQDGNFPASIYVSENDTTFWSKLSMFFTDAIYRGWEGRLDLIDGSTSVSQAEKILASILGDYQKEIKGLSEVKTAQKYAKMINDAFLDYSRSTNLFKALDTKVIEAAREHFSENNIAKLLYEGKYDELKIPLKVNQILPQGTAATEAWNDLMGGFTQSGELSSKLKKGWQNKIGDFTIGGGLDDIGKVLGKISFAQDTVNYLYQLESLLTADEMYCEMLKYVEDNCAYSVVQEAAANLYSVINDGVAGIISDITLKATNLAGKKILDFVLDKAIDGCLPLTIIKAGFDWGVTISNVLFKTGTVQELKDSLRSQAYLANCLALWTLGNGNKYYSSIGTDEETVNAKKFYYSLYMVWKARINAEETLQKLLKTEGVEWCENYSITVKVKNCLESYKNHIFTEEKMQNMLSITVSCPVNVEIYNESGTKLLTLLDGVESQGCEHGIYYYGSYNPLSKDYEKYIYYNEEDNYNINLVGTDLGLVDCAVSSIDDNGHAVEYYFNNEEVDSGTIITIDNISNNGADYKITKKEGGDDTPFPMERKGTDLVEAISISLDKSVLEMEKKDKYLLTTVFQPANTTNQNVVWTSSDSDIVSVNSDGVVTAIALGTASVSVSQGNLKQTCEITVKEKKSIDSNILVQSVSISLTATVKKGNTIQLHPTVLPENATNKTLKWSSSDETIARVDQNGLVTAVGIGEVTITAESMDGSNVSASCKLITEKNTEDPEPNPNPSPSPSPDPNPSPSPDPNPSPSPSPDPNPSPSPSPDPNPSPSPDPNPSPSPDPNPNPDDLTVELLYYIVAFDANGGKNLSRKTMTLLKDDTLGILPKVQYKNYTFKGWYTQQTGGEKVSSSTVLNAATTLYAQWDVVNPEKVKKLTLASKKKGQLQVKFGKVPNASGYQIVYSTNKKFKVSDIKKVTTASTAKTLKSLKKGKIYYVKVRAYKIDSMGIKVFGAYSTKKKIKVKGRL